MQQRVRKHGLLRRFAHRNDEFLSSCGAIQAEAT
jgi:hypothetical protein